MTENEVVEETYIKVSLDNRRISSQGYIESCQERQDSRKIQKYERNAFLTGWNLLTISQKDGYLFLLADLSSDSPIRILNETFPKDDLQNVAEGIRLLEESGYIRFQGYKWLDPDHVLCIHKTI